MGTIANNAEHRAGLPSVEDLRAAMPADCERWVVAYSGGPDSSALLHLAYQSGQSTRAVHVHHGLMSQADDWVTHCQGVCRNWGIELTVFTIQPQAAEGGLEASARERRYEVLGADLAAHECLITAHHADDQAETLLLRLLRGTGVSGLGGIQRQRRLGEGWLVRPLLNYSRAELQAYHHAHGLSSVHDPSNTSGIAARSYLREQVLPPIAERWPHYRQSLSTLSRLARDHNTVMQELLDERLKTLTPGGHGPLSVKRLAAQSQPLQPALVRRWLDQAALLPPNAKRLENGLCSLLTANADRHPQLHWPSGCLARHGEWLFRLPAHWPAIPEPQVLSAGDVDWGDLGTLRWPEEAPGPGAWRLRAPRPGDRMSWPGRPRRALKEILREARVPPWWRARIGVIEAPDGVIMGLVGLGLSAAGRARAGDLKGLEWRPTPRADGPDWVLWQAPDND